MSERTPTSCKPLIDLLEIARERGVIEDWSIDGPNFLFHRGSVRLAARAVSAGSLLRKLLLEEEQAETRRLDMDAKPSWSPLGRL